MYAVPQNYMFGNDGYLAAEYMPAAPQLSDAAFYSTQLKFGNEAYYSHEYSMATTTTQASDSALSTAFSEPDIESPLHRQISELSCGGFSRQETRARDQIGS